MVEDKLRKLIVDRYGSMIAFSKVVGMPNSTLATILERGVKKASVNNIIKICQALGISTDGLANGKIIYNQTPSNKSSVPVESLIQEIQEDIIKKNLIFNGEKMTKEEKENLANAVGFSLEIIIKQNKRHKTIKDGIK